MLYHIQINIQTGEFIDARTDKELLVRPWGVGDVCDPFAIFDRDLSPGETVEINAMGKTIVFTALEK